MTLPESLGIPNGCTLLNLPITLHCNGLVPSTLLPTQAAAIRWIVPSQALSPYFTHGLLSLPYEARAIHARHALGFDDKLVFEFGWRAFFHRVWAHQQNPDAISQDMQGATVWHDQFANLLCYI